MDITPHLSKPESGYQMLAETEAKLGRLPQAIFTASYTLLEGVLRYLTEQKKWIYYLIVSYI